MFSRYRSLFALALIGMAAVSTTATAAGTTAEDECLNVDLARGATFEDNSILIRQGREQYRRLEVTGTCPLSEADRVSAISAGGVRKHISYVGDRMIPRSFGGIAPKVCSKTRFKNVHLVKEDGASREYVDCEIVNVSAATEQEFRAGRPSR